MKNIYLLLLLFVFNLSNSQNVEIYQAENGLFGFRGSADSTLSVPRFSYAFPFHEGFSVVIEEGEYGFVNDSGLWAVQPRYDGAWDFRDSLAKVCLGCAFQDEVGEITGGKWGFVNQDGEVAVPIEYQYLGDFSPSGLAVAQSEGKWGFVNRGGELVVPAIYQEARSFTGGMASVQLNDLWGFVDKQGDEVMKPQYQKAGVFAEGLAGVQLNGKWGFVNRTGKMVIAPKYDEVGGFEGNKAVFKLRNQYGLINKEGKQLTDSLYDEMSDFENGVARVRTGSLQEPKYGLLDGNGKMVLPAQYNSISGFSQGGWAKVRQGNQVGFVNGAGKWLAGVDGPSFEDATVFVDGFAKVKKDGKWGLLKEDGEYQLSNRYDSILEISTRDKKVKVKLDGKAFWVDFLGNKLDGATSEGINWKTAVVKKKTHRIGQNVFDWLGKEQFGLFKVNKDDKWGYVDASGQLIVPLKYDGASDFDSLGIAKVCIECAYDIKFDEISGESVDAWFGGKWGLVSQSGKELLSTDYEVIMPYREKELLIKKDGQWGIYHIENGWILEAEFWWIDAWEPPLKAIRAHKGSEWMVYDSSWQVLASSFQELEYMDLPYSRARRNGKWGFVDQLGKVVVPFEYDKVFVYSEKRFPVCKNGVWGYLGEDGKAIMPLQYEEVESFSKGKAQVKYNGEYFFIDLNGVRIE